MLSVCVHTRREEWLQDGMKSQKRALYPVQEDWFWFPGAVNVLNKSGGESEVPEGSTWREESSQVAQQNGKKMQMISLSPDISPTHQVMPEVIPGLKSSLKIVRKLEFSSTTCSYSQY